MKAELHQVDSFTGTPFAGNPAGVCIPDGEPDPSWMQAVASEVGAPETAFLLPGEDSWKIRWFTPATEVDLCGHATLAAAYVLWETGRVPPGTGIAFSSRSGMLGAERNGEWITLDFPAEPASPAAAPPGLSMALGAEPVFTGRNRFDLLAELPSAATVRGLDPDYSALADFPFRGVIVTARSDLPEYDFLSRFFAPAIGIREDPVTGSAHCCLGPYWAEKLGRDALTGYQCSRRGGVVRVKVAGDRVVLGGRAVRVCSGSLTA